MFQDTDQEYKSESAVYCTIVSRSAILGVMLLKTKVWVLEDKWENVYKT